MYLFSGMSRGRRDGFGAGTAQGVSRGPAPCAASVEENKGAFDARFGALPPELSSATELTQKSHVCPGDTQRKAVSNLVVGVNTKRYLRNGVARAEIR